MDQRLHSLIHSTILLSILFQVPDEEKRRRADYVIDTSLPLDETEAQVMQLIHVLRAKAAP